MTIKTRLKFLKTRAKFCLTKPRFFKTYKTKKRLLAIFLLVVNAYIYTGVYYHISEEIARMLEPKIVYIEREAPQSGDSAPIDNGEGNASQDQYHAVYGEVVEAVSYVEGEQSPSLSIEEKIRQAFPEEPEVMLAIAKAESKLNPHVVNRANTNGSVDTGIFQVNSIHGYSEEYLLDEDNNLRVAREIYERQGKEAWVAYLNGAYKKWL